MKNLLKFIFALTILSATFITVQNTSAVSWTDSTYDMFARNNILFYGCSRGGSSNIKGICGDTAAEKIWSGLISHGLSAEQAAGVLGNIMNEGGANPACWETTAYGNASWERMKTSTESGLGLGLIQWSGGRRVALIEYIEENNPELLKYLENYTEYSYCGGNGPNDYSTDSGVGGDRLITKDGINQTDVDALFAIEINFLFKELEESYSSAYSAIKSATTPEEASDIFLEQIERPANIEGTRSARREAANYYYDELKDFQCSSSSTNTNVSSSADCLGDFIYLNQFNYPPYADYSCGPVSFTMLADMLLNKEIDPVEVIEYSINQGQLSSSVGSSNTITNVLAEHYGLQHEQVTDVTDDNIIDRISDRLKDGWMLHVSNQGHFIGIRGITSDGKWLVADSAKDETYNKAEHEPSDVVNGVNWGTSGTRHITNNAIYAIRSSAENCGSSASSCSNAGSNLGKGGFSNAEDARFIIEAFLNTPAPSPEYGMNFGNDGVASHAHNNCVSFSTWFLNYYLSFGYKNTGKTISTRGNGDTVAQNFYDDFSSQYPELTISSEPSAYSLASWTAGQTPWATTYHTGIVIGVTDDSYIIAESGSDGPDIHTFKKEQVTGGVYVNISAYIEGLNE